MFPTIFVPLPVSGLMAGGQTAGIAADFTPVLVGMLVTALAVLTGVLVNRWQTAKLMAPQPRPQATVRIPAAATA